MTQTQRSSMLEAGVNVVAGYLVALALQCMIFPAVGFHPTLAQNLRLGLAFTAASLLKNYVIRRLFNRLERVELFPICHERPKAEAHDASSRGWQSR